MKQQKRLYVERRKQGDYAVRERDSKRASITTSTQKKAILKAKKMKPGVAPDVERVRNTRTGTRDKWRKA